MKIHKTCAKSTSSFKIMNFVKKTNSRQKSQIDSNLVSEIKNWLPQSKKSDFTNICNIFIDVATFFFVQFVNYNKELSFT